MDFAEVLAYHHGTGLLRFRVLSNLTGLEEAYDPVSLALPGHEVTRLVPAHTRTEPIQAIPFLLFGDVGWIEMGYSTGWLDRDALSRIAEQLVTEAGSPIGFFIRERRIHHGIINYSRYHFSQAINGPVLGPRMKRIYHLVVSNCCDLTVAYIGTCFETWRLWVHWKRRMRATRAFITLFGDHIATLIGRYHGAYLV